MAKVFVFCIGGTGLRVMKSIIMLAASGMRANGYDIVPVLVDPHIDLEENRNLTRTIGDYVNIYNRLTQSSGQQLNASEGFFNTRIRRLEELDEQQNSESSVTVEKKTFREYLNMGALSKDDVNHYLIQTLFSKANLDNNLSVGFKGNPNVGTVVLNEMIGGADWYKAFLRHCEKGDRVFIISSIFGGTGASGYPLIEKKIKECDDRPNVKNALMGAVTVLPYYSLEDPSTSGSDIDSANFYTKAKAALSYYEKSVKADYLYYAGEQSLKANYSNDESRQEDKAHFIELVAASALFDFLGREKPDSCQAMTRAIREDAEALDYNSLGKGYHGLVRNIADFMLLDLMLDILPDERHFPLEKTHGLDKSFYEDVSYKELKEFAGRFRDWYKELADNSRSFSPLNLNNISKGGNTASAVKEFSLDGENESCFLLEMIKAGNKEKQKHGIKLRYLLDFAFKGISAYTDKIAKD
ncbi:MAG: hypothetical protein NC308_03190 [Clostridium sp.]|nr:hypothetical protein [Bacteroides sp.]MCM1197870.1 hypothetical protein [Clostridium sp.]